MARIETTIWDLALAIDEAVYETWPEGAEATQLAGTTLASLLDRAILVDDATDRTPRHRARRFVVRDRATG